MVTGDTVNHRGAEAQRVRRGGIRAGVGVVAALVLLLGLVSCTEGHGESLSQQQEWPSAGDVWQALSLRDYNTRIVVMGTAGLGMAAGIIGCFMLLRKRALLGDALSHATYPGIGLAFMLTASAGSDEKSLPALLAGAVIAGLAGVLTILAIRRFTRLKEDVALGIVLSVFFGLGVVFDGIIQHMAVGGKAGLASFIYGKTAAMLVEHAQVIGITAAVVAAISVVLYKEFRLLCFDEAFAASQGWPTLLLDLLLMAMVTAVTVVGLKAVGLILIIALLIIPAAAARFWTQRLATMMVIAAGIGAASGFLGAVASRIFDKLPAGAIIVVAASVLFVISMLLGVRRGLLVRWLEHVRLARTVGKQHLMRAIFELLEPTPESRTVALQDLLAKRSWSALQLRRIVHWAEKANLVVRRSRDTLHVTDEGLAEARRVARNHRLWEMYLITYAEIAPNHVDRDADMIEHVLGREMVDELQRLLDREDRVPGSPHPV